MKQFLALVTFLISKTAFYKVYNRYMHVKVTHFKKYFHPLNWCQTYKVYDIFQNISNKYTVIQIHMHLSGVMITAENYTDPLALNWNLNCQIQH